MLVKHLVSHVPTSFQCVGYDENGTEIIESVGLKINRLATRRIDEKDFREKLDKGNSVTELIQLLINENAIAEWEIWEDEARTQMHPITVDNILDRGLDFSAPLLEAVIEKLFPNDQRATNSPSGSGRAEKLASAAVTSLQPTASSQQPDTSA